MESILGFIAVGSFLAAILCKMITDDRNTKRHEDAWTRSKR